MYVHIGGNCSISDRIIIGIYDFDQLTTGKKGQLNHQYLQAKEQTFQVAVLGDDLPKSFIVTLEGIYLSPISTHILWQRLKKPSVLNRRYGSERD